MTKAGKTFLNTAAICITIALASCEKKCAPPPPLTKSKITIELYDALKEGDHRTALNKTVKLRDLDKGNIFLARLENSEKNRVYIEKAQEFLNAGDAEKALAEVRKGIKAHGRRKELIEAEDEIIKLAMIKRLVESLNRPLHSLQVAKDAVKLRKILKTYPPAKPFAPYIRNRIKLAFEMEKMEKDRSLFSISSDASLLLEEKSDEAPTVLAELAVESPNHPQVKKYLENPLATSPSLYIDVQE